MKITIVGAGAIGGYLGARLALAGEDVTFMARGPNLEALRTKGIRLIEQNGPYEIRGEREIMRQLDQLLQAFVDQHRMKLPGNSAYVPCYKLIT